VSAALAFADETLDAIQVLHARGRYPQLLVLLYSAIDTLGWLATASDQASGESFKEWVDTYMLPGSPLSCTADDLWGARNGLLHTATAESSLSTQGKARQLWYYGKDRSEDLLSKRIAGRTDMVAVRTLDLVEAFANGATRFTQAVTHDATLAARVNQRAALWLRWVRPDDPRGHDDLTSA
jgi:hypothetical protein